LILKALASGMTAVDSYTRLAFLGELADLLKREKTHLRRVRVLFGWLAVGLVASGRNSVVTARRK
jgi:hypothetical protein